MAQYELTDEQVKSLINLLTNAQIRGADAPKLIELLEALKNPRKAEKKE